MQQTPTTRNLATQRLGALRQRLDTALARPDECPRWVLEPMRLCAAQIDELVLAEAPAELVAALAARAALRLEIWQSWFGTAAAPPQAVCARRAA